MFIHNVFIANSFKTGDRFAYDLVIPAEKMNDEFDENEMLRFLVNVYNELGGDTTITTHVIPTQSKEWESVVERDTFFSDIKIIKSEKNFIKNLSYNISLTYYDVAYLVVCILKGNEFKNFTIEEFVEKIAADYHKEHNEELYENKQNKKTKRMHPEFVCKYPNIIVDRVLSANNGFEKYKFILTKVKDVIE